MKKTKVSIIFVSFLVLFITFSTFIVYGKPEKKEIAPIGNTFNFYIDFNYLLSDYKTRIPKNAKNFELPDSIKEMQIEVVNSMKIPIKFLVTDIPDEQYQPLEHKPTGIDSSWINISKIISFLHSKKQITFFIPEGYSINRIAPFIFNSIKDTKGSEPIGLKLDGKFEIIDTNASFIKNVDTKYLNVNTKFLYTQILLVFLLLLLMYLLLFTISSKNLLSKKTDKQLSELRSLTRKFDETTMLFDPKKYLDDFYGRVVERLIEQRKINIQCDTSSVYQSEPKLPDPKPFFSEPKVSFLDYFNQLIRNKSIISDDVLKNTYKLKNISFENDQFRLTQNFSNFWLYKDDIGDYYVFPSYSLLIPDMYKYVYMIRDYQDRLNIKASIIKSIEKLTKLTTHDNQIFAIAEKGVMVCSD